MVDKLLVEVEAQLEKKGVQHARSTTRRARWLAREGLRPEDGRAPDGAACIQEQIKRPLAEELLFGKLAAGGTVKIGVSADGKELKLDDAACRNAGAASNAAVAAASLTSGTPPKRRRFAGVAGCR